MEHNKDGTVFNKRLSTANSKHHHHLMIRFVTTAATSTLYQHIRYTLSLNITAAAVPSKTNFVTFTISDFSVCPNVPMIQRE